MSNPNENNMVVGSYYPNTPDPQGHCEECGSNQEDFDCTYCWEHIEVDERDTVKLLWEYAKAQGKWSIRTKKYIKDLEQVKKDLYEIIAELREGKV